jgi:hypothetical protein
MVMIEIITKLRLKSEQNKLDFIFKTRKFIT